MNTIIFLDIDGVLKHPMKNFWYPDAVAYLNDYCSHNNIDIVISSTWRLFKDIKFFNNILNNRVIGVTPDLSRIHKEYTRYYECIKYIQNHQVKHYVILDDVVNEYLDLSKVVKVDDQIGVDIKKIFKINSILKCSINYLITDNIDII
jgi:hypothetical protein